MEVIIKVIVIGLFVFLVHLPFIIIGWLIIYSGGKLKAKRKKTDFLTRSRNEFVMAVRSYERMFSAKADINSESYKNWKQKYGYLRNFLDGYNKMGLDKEYLKIIGKYLDYTHQYDPPSIIM